MRYTYIYEPKERNKRFVGIFYFSKLKTKKKIPILIANDRNIHEGEYDQVIIHANVFYSQNVCESISMLPNAIYISCYASCSIKLKNLISTSIIYNMMFHDASYITLTMKSNVKEGNGIILKSAPRLELSGHSIEPLQSDMKTRDHVNLCNRIEDEEISLVYLAKANKVNLLLLTAYIAHFNL